MTSGKEDNRKTQTATVHGEEIEKKREKIFEKNAEKIKMLKKRKNEKKKGKRSKHEPSRGGRRRRHAYSS